MMLSPGSKGWITKYFDLVEKGEIELKIKRPKGVKKLPFIHLTLCNSGIVFGYPLDLIFGKSVVSESWTQEEKLKLLLFEAHLFVYLQIHNKEKFSKEAFIESLCAYYKDHDAGSVKKLLSLFKKSTGTEFLEKVLTKRVDIKLKLLENKWWVNSLSNAFVYLDVILFDDFEHKESDKALDNYSNYAYNAIIAIILAAQADGVVEGKEKAMFDVFLASSGLGDEDRLRLKRKMDVGAKFDDINFIIEDHWLLKRFLIDTATLLIFANHNAAEIELQFLNEFAKMLQLSDDELEEIIGIVEAFVLSNKDSVAYLRDNSSYDKVYYSLSSRYKKILGRSKDKLALELKESKVLVALIGKSMKEELSPEEKLIVKDQLKDLAKSVPALTIFMLPGGTVLLPLLLKLIPDLVPSAFRSNQIEDDTDIEPINK